MNDRVVDRDESLYSGYSGRILLAVTSGELLISLGALILPPLLPTITGDLGISPSQAGAVMTVWWLAVAVHNYPGGRLADHLSQKTVLVAGALVTVVGLVVLSTAFTYAVLLVGVTVIGMGRGLFQPAAITQLSNLFVDRRGQALGIRNAAFTVGGTFAGGAAAVILAFADWRAAFVPIAVGLLAITGLMHVLNRQPYELHHVPLEIRDTGRRLVSIDEIRWLVVVLSIYGFAWNGATTFLPTYLQVSKGFSGSAASVAFSGVFLIGAATQPVAGLLGDRLGHLRSAAVATVACSAGIGVLLLSSNIVLVGGGLVVFGAGLAAFWPVVTAHGMQTLSDDSRGGDWGAITTVFLVAESLGSAAAGFVAEHASYDAAYAMLFVCFLSTAGITSWLISRQ
ncbi:MAG: MFS transporter [Haloarculaceae archaeon]